MDKRGEPIDWRVKGFWQPTGHLDREDLAATRPGLFDGGFSWPLLVVRRSAVEANIATMAGYAATHGFSFAPHAKTTMAPGLIHAQLAAGAWGCSVATANQALILRRLGVPRVLLANLLLDPTALRWFAAEVDRGFDAYLQVDSVAGVDAVSAAAGPTPLKVLVELGHAQGRTGARSVDEALAVARTVAQRPGLTLAGVTGYEGGVPGGAAGVSAYLDDLAALGRAVLPFAAAEPVVSAGGSAWFDLVAARLTAATVPGARRVLRSGASVTHDDGFYRERTPFTRVPGSLDAAIAVWAQVLSTPEPGLAIVGMGKRDVSFDEGLPVPLQVRRLDGTRAPATGLRLTRLNDHHGYVDVSGDVVVQPGELIRFGISHPCTAFDKWRAVPIVEDDDTVSDVLSTYF
jgi:D-serine deaminase-like pyridoxal phosphate-dependent protein